MSKLDEATAIASVTYPVVAISLSLIPVGEGAVTVPKKMGLSRVLFKSVSVPSKVVTVPSKGN